MELLAPLGFDAVNDEEEFEELITVSSPRFDGDHSVHFDSGDEWCMALKNGESSQQWRQRGAQNFS
jgi:hypothetical protein